MQDTFGVFRGYGPAPDRRLQALFQLRAPFGPAGDQVQAIPALVQGLRDGERNQVLLGVTGSGKTFTMASVIQEIQKPTLILAPNKTLAAQLHSEMKAFFPDNAVEYFVSYYDYYQPEAYLPSTNTYIEKEATINSDIERMRHSATRALLERSDTIIVASVSCIYGLGAIESYQGMAFSVGVGDGAGVMPLLRQLAALQYRRSDIDFVRGTFRVRGDRVDIFPAHYENRAWSVSFFGNSIESLHEIDVLTGKKLHTLNAITIYPNNHYVTPGPTLQQAIAGIKIELAQRLAELQQQDKVLEAQRLRERVTYDLESLAATGICAGIENYSCYLTGRAAGLPPPTLFEYLPKDALFIADESHVSVPQIQGMSAGDAARKTTLYEYGFRLPSCRHNRPLTFSEWDAMRPATLFVSATPGPWELAQSQRVIEQIIRPTGLLDPVCTVHPTEGQIDHLRGEITQVLAQGGRVLVTTLTKKMAEDLSEYLIEGGFRARYMHSDVDTLERIELIAELRRGVYDILVGINLLREGLDIPECQLIAILDADKEGYLRSRTALIQTMGRAARNVHGRVVLYADKMTASLEQALQETSRRRQLQEAYNEQHQIIPRSVQAPIAHMERGVDLAAQEKINFGGNPAGSNMTSGPGGKTTGRKGADLAHNPGAQEIDTQDLYIAMVQAAQDLDFEKAEALKKLLQARGFTLPRPSQS